MYEDWKVRNLETSSVKQTANVEFVLKNLDILASNILKSVFPVGSIYMSVSNVNPANWISNTTWAAWGSGRGPVGVNLSEAEFNTVEKTGGAKTHILTESEMPKHSHSVSLQSSTHSHSISDPGHRHPTSRQHFLGSSDNCLAGGNEGEEPHDNNWWYSTGYSKTGITISGNGSHNHIISETLKGNGESHPNLQPYITCYMFKRTS
jgi:microcystin-dependent protein